MIGALGGKIGHFPSPQSVCGHEPVFTRGRCAACHVHGRTLRGRLDGARAGVVHATEMQIYFQRCAELATEPIEVVRCRELAIEWAKIASAAAGDALKLERRIALGDSEYSSEDEMSAE